MKQYFRSKVSLTSSYLEIFISVIILVGIVIVAADLIKTLYYMIQELMNGSATQRFQAFLGDALKLIIGVEFVKMLAKHTPESVIEVLLFAIARKLIVDSSTSIDIAIGVLSIAALFAIRKYFYTSKWAASQGHVLSSSTSVSEANLIAGVNIPENMGNTLGGVVYKVLKDKGQQVLEDATVVINKVRIRIYSQNDGVIEKVELIPPDKE